MLDVPALARLNPLVKGIKRHGYRPILPLFNFINYSFDYEIETTSVAEGLVLVGRAHLGWYYIMAAMEGIASSAKGRWSTLSEMVAILYCRFESRTKQPG